ncbi:hypothetical protein KUTeg_009096 [Tegillarca granosa]|uniref:Uncharacterized protein n=1 Tax=Tegillarca granosa TaxID=220873 RepID=A0ABQ9F7G5_TEGGR|nr:hypothetical protein KUTeg_009096 [Tegillarca granosa]
MHTQECSVMYAVFNMHRIACDMFMTTTTNDTFKKFDGDHRAERVFEKTSLGKKPKKLGKFQDETQNRFDFPPYRSGQPMPAKLAEPAPTTIDLRFDNKSARDHDYQPIDIERNTQIRVPPPVSQLHDKEVKFDGRTKYNEFFKHPGTTTRVRYGDFHENRPYIPPQVKFEGSSITQSSFVPKKLEEPTRDFKPEHHLISTEGKQEFNTSYKESYTKPLVKPCKAYIYLLQQELKRQREARAQNQNQAISVK